MNKLLEKISKLFEDESVSSKQFNLIDVTAETDSATQRLFNELVTFAEPPEWIPYLPKPGSYQHSDYGVISISPDRNRNFVSNYDNGVYQKFLPIDLEHDLPNSGAVGHIEGFRLNEDMSVSAKTNWNDRGKAVITGDRFRYFSPAYKDVWTDPVDGKQYADVAVGGALTTRPFFKDKSLGPIVCKEDGSLFFSETRLYKEEDKDSQINFLQFAVIENKEGKKVADTKTIENKETEDNKEMKAPPFPPKTDDEEAEGEEELLKAKMKGKMMGEDTKVAEETKVASTATTVTLSEEMTRQFTEMNEQIKKLTESNKKYETSARTTKFTEIVTGRGGSTDGVRFFGEPSKHVNLLMKLSESFGEESPEVKEYIETQKAVAEQVNKANLFAEFGRRTAVDATSTMSEVEGLATKTMSENSGMTREQAISKVLSENPILYDKWEAEKASSR